MEKGGGEAVLVDKAEHDQGFMTAGDDQGSDTKQEMDIPGVTALDFSDVMDKWRDKLE